MLIQISVQNDYILHQMDVKTAFLNAPIDFEIYMEQPEGFVVHNDNNEKLVCKLKKSLYGLKQSGNLWNNVLHCFLIDNSFKQSLIDHCVYTRFQENDRVIIIVFVDDILISANNEIVMHEVKNTFSNKFKMKDLGKLSYFLGMNFEIGNDYISMSQENYISKLLNKFDMVNCKPKSHPCELSLNKDLLNITVEKLPESLHNNYRAIIGSIIYVML